MLKGKAGPGKNGEDSTPRQTQRSMQDKNQEGVKDVGPHRPCADPEHCQQAYSGLAQTQGVRNKPQRFGSQKGDPSEGPGV